jgi:hypothetical protein
MRDFSLNLYKELLSNLMSMGYRFIPFKMYKESKENKLIILRHDVDRLPFNSLEMAEVEFNVGICGTYYFRVVPSSFNEKIIKKIESMGHEIGYHYEDVDLILKRHKAEVKNPDGKIDEEKLMVLAYNSFCFNLEKLKTLASIRTVCMHGSPLSKYDNKIIWKNYSYNKLGIIGEPYLDLNWNEFGYFTDTGRRWNGTRHNVRDKVNSKYKFDFKSTYDMINNINSLPDKLMITLHPQRWSNNIFEWYKELITQSGKNIIKEYFLVKD